MGRRVEFCWSVGQWRAFLRGQSLLFSRESSAKPAGPRARLCLVSSSFCDFSIFRSRAAERKWNRSRVSSSCFCGRMRVGETLTFVFGTCASSISVHRQTMCRRVEFCWSVGQWRTFLRGQSLLFSRESSGPRGACDSRRGFISRGTS